MSAPSRLPGSVGICIVPKVFFDTNILIYQMDKKSTAKRDRCRSLVRKAANDGDAVISTQVLQEFYGVATKKLHMDPMVSKSIMHSFENMEVVSIGKELINEAIDASLQHKVSFWDALILVAAESARCEILYSEDLNDGQIMQNVRIVDPLKE
jgi:predicted nucleic acid-binding protein